MFLERVPVVTDYIVVNVYLENSNLNIEGFTFDTFILLTLITKFNFVVPCYLIQLSEADQE